MYPPEMLFFVLLIFSFTDRIGCSTDVFFSGEDKKTFEEAEKTCVSIDGQMLTYGREIIPVAKKCNMQSYIWIAKPWIKEIGFFKANMDDADKYAGYVSNASSLTCISYCQKPVGRYTYIGVTNTSCYCFGSFEKTEQIKRDKSELPLCPGNPAETCGIDDIISLYEKVKSLSQNDDMRNRMFRKVVNHVNGKVRLHELKNIEKHYFFCSKFKDDHTQTLRIHCSLNQSTHGSETTTVTSGTKHPSNESTTPGITVSVVTTSDKNGFPLGLIVGISVGVLVVVVLMLAVLCYRIRKKRPDRSRNEKPVRRSVLDHDGNYDTPEEINKQRTDSGVYDHTCHLLLRNDQDDAGNIYDHTANIEGVYSTTVTSERNNTDDNVYSHAGTSEQDIGDYDSCSNVQNSLTEGKA